MWFFRLGRCIRYLIGWWLLVWYMLMWLMCVDGIRLSRLFDILMFVCSMGMIVSFLFVIIGVLIVISGVLICLVVIGRLWVIL